MTRESTEMIQNVHVVTISFGILQEKNFIDVRQKVILLIIMGSALLLSPLETST